MEKPYWEGKEYSYFSHKNCEYFPCHKGADPENFNCLFCYCPLYALGDKCGGNFRFTESGIKDCTECKLPHRRENFGYVTGKYSELAEIVRKHNFQRGFDRINVPSVLTTLVTDELDFPNLSMVPFPSGAALDELALTAEPQKGFRPRVTDCRFSLSGMQNQVENKFKTEKPEDMARFALETVANAVIKATEQAKERYDVPVLCAGGVMASRVIRARMEKRFGSGVSFAEPTLSGDNAVGVAVLAARLYRKTGADGQ